MTPPSAETFAAAVALLLVLLDWGAWLTLLYELWDEERTRRGFMEVAAQARSEGRGATYAAERAASSAKENA